VLSLEAFIPLVPLHPVRHSLLIVLDSLQHLSGLGETLVGQSLALLEPFGGVNGEEGAGESKLVGGADLWLRLVDLLEFEDCVLTLVLACGCGLRCLDCLQVKLAFF
jgi:hypothetical protein